jgi:hypothetical protein
MDFVVGGHHYRSRKLNAKQQLHIARRLSGTSMHFLLTTETDNDLPQAIETAASESGMSVSDIKAIVPNLMPIISLRALGQLSDADADFVVNTCLSVLQRQSGTNGAVTWTNVLNPQTSIPQFQDISLKEMLELTVSVLRENLADFFGESHSTSPAQSALVPQT